MRRRLTLSPGTRRILIVFMLVTRRASGWCPAAPTVYDSEDDARQDIPAVAEALGRPQSLILITEQRLHTSQAF